MKYESLLSAVSQLIKLHEGKEAKVFPAHAMKVYRGVVKLTPQQLYSRRRCPGYPLNTRLGGPESGTRRFGRDFLPGF
jgi:hypothetical protein